MLDMFSSPRAVAVIGASRDPAKLGYNVLHNIVQYGYAQRGAVYPINPNAKEILGLKCYPSVLVVAGAIDLAVIVIPSRHVMNALIECGEKGIKGAVIISAGFREMGQEGWHREREIVSVARRYGMRLIGPNCLGVIDTISGLNASFAVGMPRQGTIALMSQSGALCTSILDMALADGVGFSRFISLGNKADLDEIAFIKEWADDPHTRVIIAYLEGIGDGVEFVRVAGQVSRHKPIIAIKAGTTSAGSRAVSSHTGTLAGLENAYEAAFRQSGVIRARSVQELFDFSIAFARQPLLQNARIAIVTNAGGPGIMATDACELAGLQLAPLEAETTASLRSLLPPAASVLNPVDVLGDAQADRYEQTVSLVLNDPNVGGVIVIVTPQIMTQVEATARVVGQLSKERKKPILGCFMGREAVAQGVQILNEHAVPNYPVPERAVASMAAMMAYRRWRLRPAAQLETFAVDQDRVRHALQRVRDEGRVMMGDAEAWEILEAYGIATPKTRLARSPDQAVRLAQEIGFPVAVKIVSPDILHKTEVGGVQLNVATDKDVRKAYDLMVYRAGQYVPGAEIWGCLVQEMIVGGKEVIVGMHRDPHFGPLMMFGLGGVYVEALRDVAFRLVPFDRRDAREMIGEIRAASVFRGVRGENASDVEALSEALLRLSQLAVDFPEILEFDINPVTVFEDGHGIVGIDPRLVLG
ncbi:MAG: acetate--CoA ligase family protein [Anaerolineae bacterium]|nr:acetate--CoA ligase family protein [Anaerolineae bacterium]